LSLDQLIEVGNKDFEEVNDYVSSKGWQFDKAADESEGKSAKISWGFNKSKDHFDDSWKATAWLKLCNPGNQQYITYQFHNANYYSLYKTKIAAYGMEKWGSDIKGNSIETIYSGANYLISISVSSNEDSGGTTYVISVLKKSRLLDASTTDN
jgi:hypothetical protein